MLWILVQVSLASLSAGSGLANVDNSVMSQPVKGSDKKFFGKDYPWDKQPAVNILHFKHPYPVVQDSDDFDRDFVKDENSDSGEYKAQTEYDRLRHQLVKEKAQIAKATKAKTKSEAELEGALKREAAARKEHEKKQAAKAEKEAKKKAKAEERKKKKEEERKRGLSSGKDSEKDDDKDETEDDVIPGSKTPGGVASSGEVDIASQETKKAMDNMEECKKQLQETENKLKQLTKELEEAKKQQEETQKKADTLSENAKVREAEQTVAHEAAQEENKEYLDAKDAYMKQQALVEQMEQGITAAAEKVRVMRDSADKDGGVYPTKRSGATQSSVAPILVLIALAASTWTQ